MTQRTIRSRFTPPVVAAALAAWTALAALAALAPPAALAQAPPAQGAPSPQGETIKKEILMWIEDAEDKLLQLAEAMPESAYAWSPDKGVRSTAGVFMHVAGANYGLPTFAGVKPPQSFKFETFEGSLTRKADIVKALRDSFAHMKSALKGMSDADMEKPTEFFGIKTTARGLYLLLLSHAHEHLGQAIAYARSNKVVPPWSAKEKAGS